MIAFAKNNFTLNTYARRTKRSHSFPACAALPQSSLMGNLSVTAWRRKTVHFQSPPFPSHSCALTFYRQIFNHTCNCRVGTVSVKRWKHWASVSDFLFKSSELHFFFSRWFLLEINLSRADSWINLRCFSVQSVMCPMRMNMWCDYESVNTVMWEQGRSKVKMRFVITW